MVMLNGLPEGFKLLISAHDRLGDDKTFTFELVKSRLLQEEQCNQQRVESLLHKAKESAFVSESCYGSCSSCYVQNIKRCSYCGKN